MSRNFSNELANQLKSFRECELKVTLSEMCRTLKVPVTTLYNFENGNSTNVNNIEYYVRMCKDYATYSKLKDYLGCFIENAMYNPYGSELVSHDDRLEFERLDLFFESFEDLPTEQFQEILDKRHLRKDYEKLCELREKFHEY